MEFFKRAGVYLSRYSNPADVYLRELSKPDLSKLFEESRKSSNVRSQPPALSALPSINSEGSEEEKPETRETEVDDESISVISHGDLEEIG